MKNILIALIMLNATILSAQDKIDRLIDKVDKIAEQQTATNIKLEKITEQISELNKQVAVNSSDIRALDKRLDVSDKNNEKRFDVLLYVVIGSSGALFVGIISLLSFIIWDRRAANAPLEATTAELKKEINLLKEKEREHQEKEQKMESLLKKLLEKFPDLVF